MGNCLAKHFNPLHQRKSSNQEPAIAPSSAELVSSNHDLMTEILLRMPAKSLLRFKCVSKEWFSLISDSRFCYSHARHGFLQGEPTSVLVAVRMFYYSSTKFRLIPLRKEDNVVSATTTLSLDHLSVPRIEILHSCNGLMLCTSTFLTNKKRNRKKHYDDDYIADYCRSVVDDDDCGFRLYVCNPTTRQFRTLSHPTLKSRKDYRPFAFLAFDPSESPHYKVIHFILGQANDISEIHVYSSEASCWRLLPIRTRVPRGMTIVDGVLWNHAIHWYSFEKTSLYFDADGESLKEMPMPSSLSSYGGGDHSNVLYFGGSRGHLHLVVKSGHSPLEFDVLEMLSDYSGWFLRYHLDLNRMRSLYPELSWCRGNCNSRAFSLISLVRAEEEEDSRVILFFNGEVKSYNLHDGMPKEVCSMNWCFIDPTWRDAYQCLESFICV